MMQEIEELRRQLKNAYLVRRRQLSADILVAGQVVTGIIKPYQISRHEFRWKLNGKPASYRKILELAEGRF
jgi:hypothetical protein